MSPKRTVPVRHRLDKEREALTHRFVIKSIDASVKGYITVGLYEDGDVGEIFIKINKQGSMVSGFADAWAVAISMLLQCGVPLEEVVHKFKGLRFDPGGFTDNAQVRITTSVVDYVCRYLESRFLDTSRDSESEDAA
jgi:ribonucleoside-diphosphate reductase alpha chain